MHNLFGPLHQPPHFIVVLPFVRYLMDSHSVVLLLPGAVVVLVHSKTRIQLQSKTRRLLLFSRRCQSQTNRLNKRTHFHCDSDLHPSSSCLVEVGCFVWSRGRVIFESQNHCSLVFHSLYDGLTKLRDDNGVQITVGSAATATLRRL